MDSGSSGHGRSSIIFSALTALSVSAVAQIDI